MNTWLKDIRVIASIIIIAIASVGYGALTAPQPTIKQSSIPTQTINLDKQLDQEQPVITDIITATFPIIKTDYMITKGKLFDQGQWYGAILTYKGSDSANRDTLRILLQKKQGIWIVRTTPPQPVLSSVTYPDVPKSILRTLNKAVSLPGSDIPPVVSSTE